MIYDVWEFLSDSARLTRVEASKPPVVDAAKAIVDPDLREVYGLSPSDWQLKAGRVVPKDNIVTKIMPPGSLYKTPHLELDALDKRATAAENRHKALDNEVAALGESHHAYRLSNNERAKREFEFLQGELHELEDKAEDSAILIYKLQLCLAGFGGVVLISMGFLLWRLA